MKFLKFAPKTLFFSFNPEFAVVARWGVIPEY